MKITNNKLRNLILLWLMIFFSFCNKGKTSLESPDQQNYYKNRIESLKVYETDIPNNNLYGLTVTDNAKLLAEADSNSQVVAILPFATPFQVSEEKIHRFYNNFHVWYRIKITNSALEGWISFREGTTGLTKEDSLTESDLPDLFYSVGNNSAWGHKGFVAAERIFNTLIERYPDQQVLVEDGESVYRRSAKKAALSCLAEMFKRQEDYSKTFFCYEELLKQDNLSRNDSLAIKRKIMLIYYCEMKDTLKAIELCHQFIRDYPDIMLSGDEWNLWPDIEAARIIENYYSLRLSDIKKLSDESRKILTHSNNPPVILLGTQGIIIDELHKGNIETGKSILLEAILKYPSEIRYYFKEPVNYSAGLINSVVEWLINQKGDYPTAIDLVKSIKEKIINSELENYCDCKMAYLLDYGAGDLDAVIVAYEKVTNDESRWYEIGLPGNDIIKNNFIDRLETIKSFRPIKCKINTNNVILKFGLKSKPDDSETLTANTIVSVLYKEKEITKVNNKYGQWAKVRLENGKVGWIFDYFLQSIKEESIFSPLEQNKDVWSMAGKDLHRSSTIKAQTIHNPALKTVLNNAREEAVFADVNNDKILDIITYSAQGLTAFDGKIKKVLWLFECKNGNVPLIYQKTIFVALDVSNHTNLYAIELSTGKQIWILDGDESGGSNSSPAYDQEKIYLGTSQGDLLAVDKNNGSIIWKFPTAHRIIDDIIIDNGRVYFLSKDEFFGRIQLYAVNTITGRLVWQYDMKQNDNGSLCFENEKLICPSDGNCISAINSDNGKVLWQTNFTDKIPEDSFKPIDRVRRPQKMIREMNRRESPRVQQSKVASRKASISYRIYLSVDKDNVYATIENILIALDNGTGKILWTYTYSKSLRCSPAVVDDAVYVRSIDNIVHAVSKTDGKPLWKYQIEATGNGGDFSPTVAQDLIFIGATNEKIYVLGEE